MRRVARLVWVSVVVGALLAPAVSAEGVSDDGRVPPVLGADFRISGSNATGQGDSPAVAWNESANEYLVVWMDDRNVDARGYDIYGRRVGAGGVLVGAEFRISGAAGMDHEVYPAVAWNGTASEYLVVWQDWRNAATHNWDTYGQRLDADRSRLGVNFRISGRNATSDEYSPAVAWGGTTNEYMVVWRDGRNAATRGVDVYGRRVGADGQPIGGDFCISGPNAISSDLKPALAWNGAVGEYLVVWEDWRNELTRGRDTYGRRVAG